MVDAYGTQNAAGPPGDLTSASFGGSSSAPSLPSVDSLNRNVVATDNQGAARPTLPPLSNQWQQRSPFPYAQQPYPVDALRSSSAPAGYQNASQAMQAPLAQSASLPGYAPAQGFAGYYSDPSAYYQNLAAMQAMQGMSGMAGMQAAFSNQGIMSGAGIAAANMTPSNFSTMTAAAQMLGMMGQGQAGVQGQGLQAPQGVQAQQNLQAQQSLQAQQLQLQNQQLQAQMAHLQSQQQAAQQQQQQQAQQAQQMLPGMPHQPPQQFTNIPQQGRPAVYAAGPPGLRQQPASVQQQQQYAQGAGDRRSPRAPAQQQAVQQYDNYNENEEDPLDAEIRRSYTCPFCGKGYTTSGHLARHRRTHLNINPFSCPVEGCPLRFHRADNMKSHARSHARRLGLSLSELMKKAQQSIRPRRVASGNGSYYGNTAAAAQQAAMAAGGYFGSDGCYYPTPGGGGDGNEADGVYETEGGDGSFDGNDTTDSNPNMNMNVNVNMNGYGGHQQPPGMGGMGMGGGGVAN